MRRLWAHIIAALTILVAVGATFTSIFVTSSQNIEYRDGREMTFRLSDKEDTAEGDKIFDGDATNKELRQKAIEKMSEEIEERLNIAKVTKYEISIIGDDTLKVKLAQETSEEYLQIAQFLTFNGVFALSDSGDNFAVDTEFLTTEKVRLETYNGFPTIVIPVNTETEQYKAVIEGAKASEGESSTDADGNSKTTKFVYLWYDYVEGDTVSKTIEGNDDYDKKVAAKILMKFDTENLYYPDKKDNKLSANINVDTDGDNKISTAEIRNAYNKSRFYVNLLNASKLDYDISFIHETIVPAFIENVVNNGDGVLTLAWSKTLIATLSSIIVLTLILILFYRLGALSIFTSSILTLFASVGYIVALSAEFNTFGIIGLVLVSLASLTSGVIYMSKLKSDAYRGHTLKKANNEAAKRSMLPIIDINLVVILMGVFSYLIAGPLLRTFAVVTVLGGLTSILVNLLLLRGLMWLATNTTKLHGKYEVFGINPNHVPNHLLEEKQTYFGYFQNVDFTKKKKPVAIVSLILFVASLAGSITFGTINNGQVFNTGSTTLNSEIYFETINKEASYTTAKVNELFDEVLIYEDGNTTKEGKKLSTYIASDLDAISIFEYTETIDKVDVTTYYTVISLNKALKNEVIATSERVTTSGTLEEVMEELLSSTNVTFSLKEGKLLVEDQPSLWKVSLATLTAILVVGVYLTLRYRLSRGISSIVLPIVSSTIAIGLVSLARLTASSYIAIVLPLVATASFIFEIILMNKERELVLDSKDKNKNSVAIRREISVKATSLAFTSIGISLLLLGYNLVSFIGFGPSEVTLIYVSGIVGILLGALFVTTLFAPMSMSLYSLFSKVREGNKKPKKNKPNKRIVRKSGEPEEAIFIGIND